MKKIIKIEIIVLVFVLLVAAVLTLLSAGALMWLRKPVAAQREIVPIATEALVEETPESTEEEAAIPQELEALDMTDLPVDRELTAKNYFVYDVREGVYLQQKGDLNGKLYPASITKLLSVYVLLQYLDPADTVTVGDALTLVQPDSSLANLREGDQLTVGQLIEAMMLPSGNDAAQTAAVAAGRAIGGSHLTPEEASSLFVTEMNKQAVNLGMTSSRFANADGFHRDDHYTSMADLTTLATKILADPTIIGYTSTISDEVTLQGRKEEWKNTNFLLNPEYAYYIPATIGLKTGYTGEAGSCLLSAFFMEDRILLIGVFGCPAYTEDRYQDTAALFNETILK